VVKSDVVKMIEIFNAYQAKLREEARELRDVLRQAAEQEAAE
jgi:hypothetical protein